MKEGEDPAPGDPKKVKTLMRKANSSNRRGSYKDALSYYNEVLKIEPDHEKALIGAGHALDQLGVIEDAVRYYESVLNINENHRKALERIVADYGKLGNKEMAKRYRDRLEDINPGSPKTLKARLGRPAKVDSSEASIDMDGSPETDDHTIRAIMKDANDLSKSGKYKNALDRCEHVLTIDPNHIPAFILSGNILNRRGSHNSAISWYKKALR